MHRHALHFAPPASACEKYISIAGHVLKYVGWYVPGRYAGRGPAPAFDRQHVAAREVGKHGPDAGPSNADLD